MGSDTVSTLEKAAVITRYLIVVAFAFALSGGFGFRGGNPAHAASPISAAPGYLSFTVKNANNSKFYITDTNRKTICAYSLNGDQVRLVSARKIDIDSRIVDGTLKAPVNIENGVTRDEAKEYLKNCQPTLEAAAKKFGLQNIGGM
jgi:hypothetical protein